VRFKGNKKTVGAAEGERVGERVVGERVGERVVGERVGERVVGEKVGVGNTIELATLLLKVIFI
jgi:hypothetical protein